MEEAATEMETGRKQTTGSKFTLRPNPRREKYNPDDDAFDDQEADDEVAAIFAMKCTVSASASRQSTSLSAASVLSDDADIDRPVERGIVTPGSKEVSRSSSESINEQVQEQEQERKQLSILCGLLRRTNPTAFVRFQVEAASKRDKARSANYTTMTRNFP